ncbi:MAG: helix-turn-helix transcriptional regulator [Spirochaetes bacterium]|nr:helix-turn-helix transcriptional regulator [Spirochaetota bacterium]
MAPKNPPPEWRPNPPVELAYGRYRLSLSDGRTARFDVATTNAPHRHLHYFELCLVVAGRGEYAHGGERFPLAPGTVFIADPDVVHEISSHRTRDLFLRFWNLVIRDSTLATGDAFEERLVESFLLSHRVAHPAYHAILDYLPLLSRAPGREWAASRCAEIFILEMLGLLSRASPKEAPTPERPDGAVERVLSHIRRNLAQPLPLRELASVAGMSERNLSLRMRKALGRTVHSVVREQRLSQAAMLLGQHFRVGEVARMVGVEDPGQFTRMFTRHFGLSPKRFQAVHFGEEAPVYTQHEGI